MLKIFIAVVSRICRDGASLYVRCPGQQTPLYPMYWKLRLVSWGCTGLEQCREGKSM